MKSIEDFLLSNGFTKVDSIILPSYTLDISNFESEFKQLSVTVEPHNQYVSIRCGDLVAKRHEDEIITIYNSDINGELTIEYLTKLIEVMIWKIKK